MELAIIGTSVEGSGSALVARARRSGLTVVMRGTDAAGLPGELRESVRTVDDYAGFLDAMEHPRRFLFELPPGLEIDALIDEAYVVMEPSDVVIDLSGSWWCDTLRRFRRMRHRSLYYVDAAEIGAGPARTLLASGDAKGVAMALDVLAVLAQPGRAAAAGAPGAAHYAAMLAAGLRAERAQAESELRQLLEAFPAPLAADEIAAVLGLDDAASDRRAAWLVDDAVHLEAAVPLLAQAVMLDLAQALDEHRIEAPPPRLGAFIRHEDIL